MLKKSYSKLIRCLGTNFSIEIFSNQLFLFQCYIEFLINLFADFFKFFKCRLFNENYQKIYRKYL